MRDQILKITISLKDYSSLLHNSNKLRALEEAGVDNWEGYDNAMERLEVIESGSSDDQV